MKLLSPITSVTKRRIDEFASTFYHYPPAPFIPKISQIHVSIEHNIPVKTVTSISLTKDFAIWKVAVTISILIVLCDTCILRMIRANDASLQATMSETVRNCHLTFFLEKSQLCLLSLSFISLGECNTILRCIGT